MGRNWIRFATRLLLLSVLLPNCGGQEEIDTLAQDETEEGPAEVIASSNADAMLATTRCGLQDAAFQSQLWTAIDSINLLPFATGSATKQGLLVDVAYESSGEDVFASCYDYQASEIRLIRYDMGDSRAKTLQRRRLALSIPVEVGPVYVNAVGTGSRLEVSIPASYSWQ